MKKLFLISFSITLALGISALLIVGLRSHLPTQVTHYSACIGFTSPACEESFGWWQHCGAIEQAQEDARYGTVAMVDSSDYPFVCQSTPKKMGLLHPWLDPKLPQCRAVFHCE